MPQPIRYQPQELYGEQGQVTTHLGLDPLTGLPVLIYTFASAPTVDVGVLESENIPGILASSFDGGVGKVVTAYSADYGLVAPGEVTLTPDFVVEAARGVRDAARSGVVHGDLHPGRFLHAEGHVLIEGYGVPWTPEDGEFVAPEGADERSYASDVYSLSKSLLFLGRDQFPSGVIAALERGLAADPAERPDAAELYEAVKAALKVTRTPATPQPIEAGFGELTLPVREGGAPPDDTSGGSTAGSSVSDFDIDLALEEIPEEYGPPGSGDPEPLTINTDPGEVRFQSPPSSAPPLRPSHKDRAANDSSPGFVKDLPPGATYHSGDVNASAPPGAFTYDFDEEGPTRQVNWGRIGLLGAIGLAVVAVVVTLFLLRPRTNFGNLGPPEAASFLVNVGVEPTSLPPVTLIVVDSPPDSRWRPGTIFGTAPSQVVLDRGGRWSFVGEYQQRRSAVVTIEVPTERAFTLVMPAPPPSQEP